eukprot:5467441-Prymnesium_polylepis.1
MRDASKAERVQAARAARRIQKEMRDESKAKRVQERQNAKLTIEQLRRLGMSLTENPRLMEYDAAFRAERQKAAATTLARKMKDPAFAERYMRKMLGRRFRAGGRMTGLKKYGD